MSPLDQLCSHILDGPSGPRIGAFLDFDGTLIDGYSALAFYRNRLGRFEIGPIEAAQTLLIGLRGVTTRDQFLRALTLSLRAWKGRSEDELAKLGERMFRQHIAGWLFPQAYRLVRAHQRMGHTVVIASSATRFQVEPIARELGIQHVLCTPIESEGGMLTGRAGRPVPFAEGKAEAVRQFAIAHQIELPRSYGYSNGDEDVAFLEAVGYPQAVNPQPGLAQVAAERHWPVHRFPRPSPGGLVPALRTTAAWAGVFSGFGMGLFFSALNRNRRQGVDLGFSLAGDLGTALAGIDLRVRGVEHLWSQRPAVFITNHQSSLVDVLVLFKLLRSDFVGITKKEAADIPVVGQFFRFADFAFVDRGNQVRTREAMAPVVDRLRAGLSVVIAPEGTRSYTPRLGPFKKGAFHIAMQGGVPIVPIVIHNAGELMWRNAKTMRAGTIHVTVLPPVPTRGWTLAELPMRVEDVRGRMIDTLDDGPSPSSGEAAPVRVPLDGGHQSEISA